jgi:hypothetical protein
VANTTAGAGLRRGVRGMTSAPRKANPGDFVLSLEERSRVIRDPVAKLRYIRRSLARYQETDRKLQAVPLSPVRWLLYRLTRLDRLRPLFSANPNGSLAAAVTRGGPAPKQPARPAGASLAAVGILALVGIAAASYQAARGAQAESPGADPVPPPVAENLPSLPAAVVPDHIWRVEHGKGWELYSSGLRVDTSYAVAGEARRFRVFHTDTGLQEGVHREPVGILFHTTESDLWPLEESFNKKLLDSSQSLLRYLQRNRVYNYLVDRFGRVYRIVEEEHKANHAGNSIWSRGDSVYLNLNNAFLGVSFETRWEGASRTICAPSGASRRRCASPTASPASTRRST